VTKRLGDICYAVTQHIYGGGSCLVTAYSTAGACLVTAGWLMKEHLMFALTLFVLGEAKQILSPEFNIALRHDLFYRALFQLVSQAQDSSYHLASPLHLPL
jgi:hypothetical protein